MDNAYLVHLIDTIDGIEFATILEDDEDLSNLLQALDRDKYKVVDIQTIEGGLTRSIDFYKKEDGLTFGTGKIK